MKDQFTIKLHRVLPLDTYNKLAALSGDFRKHYIKEAVESDGRPAVVFMPDLLKCERTQRLQRDAEYRAKRKAEKACAIDARA